MPGIFILEILDFMSEKIYTVSQLNRYIKNRFDDDAVLHNLMIKGEISNFKLHTSGHCYFTLKDNSTGIKCVAFRSNAMNFRFAPQNGMKVIAGGYVSVYERDGAYQLYVKELFPEGIGELTLALEELKKRLYAEGLFDDVHKQELPFYPKVIGVVTSRTGAVIRDICHVAKRRNPYVKIVLYSVLVQGDEAAEEIAQGIEFFNERFAVDAIIVGRGGGSMEDLWAFNEERVVRAIFASKIPVISAVGHETDYTLSDLVSDVRAATPSQAAELAVPEKAALINYVEGLHDGLIQQVKTQVHNKKIHLAMIVQNSALSHSERLLLPRQQQLDTLIERLKIAIDGKLNAKVHRAELLTEKLNTLNPAQILQRGFSLVKKDNTFIKNAADISIDDELDIVLHDGYVKTKVIDLNFKQDKQG